MTFRQPSIPPTVRPSREKAPELGIALPDANFLSTTRLNRCIETLETGTSLIATHSDYVSHRLGTVDSFQIAKMMHPARQAYVEEAAEVRVHWCHFSPHLPLLFPLSLSPYIAIL